MVVPFQSVIHRHALLQLQESMMAMFGPASWWHTLTCAGSEAFPSAHNDYAGHPLPELKLF